MDCTANVAAVDRIHEIDYSVQVEFKLDFKIIACRQIKESPLGTCCFKWSLSHLASEPCAELVDKLIWGNLLNYKLCACKLLFITTTISIIQVIYQVRHVEELLDNITENQSYR